MSHAFSSPNQDPGSQRLSEEEAKLLIRNHQNRESELQGSVTVQAMAETLGLPTWQVQQMVQELRTKTQAQGQMRSEPMSSSTWLKTRLWIWALIALIILGAGPLGMRGLGGLRNGLRGPGGLLRPADNRTVSDGIYDHDKVVAGRAFGMVKAPPGFSFEIKYGTVDAAANGDSKHFVHVEDLSAANVAIVQEQYTNDILDGFSKAIAKSPPDWVNGEAVGVTKPNYYPAGLADPIDITLNKQGFPYDPSSPAGKQMHDKLLHEIQAHWSDITD